MLWRLGRLRIACAQGKVLLFFSQQVLFVHSISFILLASNEKNTYMLQMAYMYFL